MSTSLIIGLTTHSSHTHLHLGANDIGPEECQQLSSSLSHLIHLTYLNFELNHMCTNGCQYINTSISRLMNLIHIDVSENDICPQRRLDFLSSLNFHINLEYIRLLGNHFGTQECEVFLLSQKNLTCILLFDTPG